MVYFDPCYTFGDYISMGRIVDMNKRDVVLIIVLLVKPTGILGKKIQEKV